MKPNSRRVAAAIGALAVSGLAVTGVIAGTASAAGTGTCTSSVNVRSEPATTAPIVGVCERGESTSVGETQDGYVELPEYGGWAVADYVSTSSSSSPQTGTESSDASEDSLTSDSTEPSASSSPSSSPSSAQPGTSAEPSTGSSASPSASPSGSPSTAPSDSDSAPAEPSSTDSLFWGGDDD